MQPTLRVLGLVLAPIVVFLLGLRLMDWTTGWHGLPAQVAETTISTARYDQCLERFGPEAAGTTPGRQEDPQTSWRYGIGDICAFVAALDEVDLAAVSDRGPSAAVRRPFSRYMQYLRADQYFPVIYGIPFVVALLLLVVLVRKERAKSREPDPMTFRTWALVAAPPVVTVIADVVENRTLLTLFGSLGTGSGPVVAPQLLPWANAATLAKLAAGGTSVILLAILGLASPALWRQLRYEMASLRTTPISSILDFIGWWLTLALQTVVALYLAMAVLTSVGHGEVVQSLGFDPLRGVFEETTRILVWQIGYFGAVCGLGLVVGMFLRVVGFPLIASTVGSIGALLLLFGFNPEVQRWFGAPSYLPRVVLAELLLASLFVVTRLRVVVAGEASATKSAVRSVALTWGLVKPKGGSRVARDIVICLDGTWNHPSQPGEPTNVFRLWRDLDGTIIEGSRKNSADNTKKATADPGSRVSEQVARYYRGLGNAIDHPWLDRLLGGAFGFGAEKLRDRVYTDIVYNHRPGDRIHLVAFSRGAAIARLVASRVTAEGIPKWMVTFRFFGALYTVLQSEERLTQHQQIRTLALFDTVTRIGVSSAFGGRLREVQLGDDLRIDPRVERVVHMVSLDEQRDAFVPTLVAPDAERVEEVWFVGGHSDIGGGYADGDLAKITYAYLRQELKRLRFDPVRRLQSTDEAHLGARHQETGMLYEMITRQPPAHATIHDSVWKRIAADETYRPRALRLWNIELEREQIRRERWETLVASHGDLAGDAPSDPVDAVVEPEDDSEPAEQPDDPPSA